MAMMPLTDDEELLEPWFKGMRTLLTNCAARRSTGWRCGSSPWGMSQDYRIAARVRRDDGPGRLGLLFALKFRRI
jgi:uncharacterized pyridoxal phosphate-containing UPF0001 family protein